MGNAFRNIGIWGVGLIGGSLGLAFKRADPRVHILGIGRDASRLRTAQQMGAIDEYVTELNSALRELDLLILATPIDRILESLPLLARYLSAGTVVTDVGSTKRRICEQGWKHLSPEMEFIGGHPIAGREVVGIENSLPTLFEKAPYILCAGPESNGENLNRLEQLVAAIGATPLIMTPEEHDRTLAWISHIPQLISTALANLASRERTEISGTGFKDMSRLAGSSYSVWKSIIDTNADNIDFALKVFSLHLEKMRANLRTNWLAEEFDRAGDVYHRVHVKKP